MRKFAGVLCALAMVGSVGVLVATPAGAAAGAGCKTLTGVATFSKPLPILSSAATVTTTVKIVTKLAGCTGAGGATGVATSTSVLTKENCKAFSSTSSAASKPAKTNIVWAKKQTSVSMASLKANGKLLQSTLTSTITTGLYKGTKTTTTVLGSLPSGGCTTKPLATISFKSITKLVNT